MFCLLDMFLLNLRWILSDKDLRDFSRALWALVALSLLLDIVLVVLLDRSFGICFADYLCVCL
jgi:hypothetical protein